MQLHFHAELFLTKLVNWFVKCWFFLQHPNDWFKLVKSCLVWFQLYTTTPQTQNTVTHSLSTTRHCVSFSLQMMLAERTSSLRSDPVDEKKIARFTQNSTLFHHCSQNRHSNTLFGFTKKCASCSHVNINNNMKTFNCLCPCLYK